MTCMFKGDAHAHPWSAGVQHSFVFVVLFSLLCRDVMLRASLIRTLVSASKENPFKGDAQGAPRSYGLCLHIAVPKGDVQRVPRYICFHMLLSCKAMVRGCFWTRDVVFGQTWFTGFGMNAYSDVVKYSKAGTKPKLRSQFHIHERLNNRCDGST